MARKKKHEEHENHERWLVSYADFITLLFAFFVVMYSVSSVNEGKYRILSDALIAAFRSPPKSMEPIQVGSTMKSPVDGRAKERPTIVELPNAPLPQQYRASVAAGAQGMRQLEQAMRRMADEIERAMAPLIDKDLIKVRRGLNWVEVEINASVLFASGSAQLSAEALPVLEKLAAILTPLPHPIHVEGFTDNVPINTVAYPSNWELSAARAASVVHLFTRYGVEPRRMVAIGFGEYRPIADNDTEEGRSRNRRVVLVILAQMEGQHVRELDRSVPRDEAPAPEPAKTGGIETQGAAPEPAPEGGGETMAPAPVGGKVGTHVPNGPSPSVLRQPSSGEATAGEPPVAVSRPADEGVFTVIAPPIRLPFPTQGFPSPTSPDGGQAR